PSLHGVQARGRGLLPDTPTLFKIFRDHGYKAPNIAYLTDITNFSNLGLGPRESGILSEAAQPGQELFQWLHRHHREKFILWYHYRFLHLPYDPPDPYNIFLTGEMKARLESKALKTVLTESVIPYDSISFTPEEQEAVIALYDGRLRELDHFLERLYKRLTRWNLHRNTLLVITSDHGEELFEHGFLGHASTAIHSTLYDEVLKIPLILYGPSRVKGGVRMKKQVRQVDIMPTILDAAGLPLPETLNGVSLLPRIQGREEEKSLDALSETVMGGYQRRPDQETITLRSIRTEPFKLICVDEDGEETCRLFDLSQDKGEKTDISDVKQEIAKGLRGKLKKSFEEMQARRLVMLAGQKPLFTREDIPKDARLEKPVILFPPQGSTIHLEEQGGRMALRWTGRKDLAYVIEYDAGQGWRNLKGAIPVQGNEKVFGPLPREAWEPLPYWNPYRIRVAPYGLEEYWSDWLEFNLER
ncbi:MAG: sulfatase-like hydrolase/transferase, partial [Pseudomonadota bacterium]